MTSPPNTPDSLDLERSRAAVAVACLQWLRCTGPAIDLEANRAEVDDLPRGRWPTEDPAPALDPCDRPHPLWDRWLDG